MLALVGLSVCMSLPNYTNKTSGYLRLIIGFLTLLLKIHIRIAIICRFGFDSVYYLPKADRLKTYHKSNCSLHYVTQDTHQK